MRNNMRFKNEMNVESLTNALVRLVVEFFVLFLIYFWVLGANTNLQNSWFFLTVSFFLMVSVVPVQVQYELILKYAGNWRKCFEEKGRGIKKIECDELNVSVPPLSNIWSSAYHMTLPFSLLGAVGFVIYHYYFNMSLIWLEIVAIVLVAIACIVPLVISLNKRCLFPACFFLSSGQANSIRVSQSEDDYFFYHHILPWLPITTLTSGLLAFKMSEETLFASASLDVFTTATYVTSTSYVTLLWMWNESKNQTKIEQEMKFFDSEKVKNITSNELFFLIHSVATGVLCLSLAIGYLFFEDGFSQGFIIIYIIIIAMLSGAFGNILGVVSANASVDMDDMDDVDLTDML